MDIKTVQDKRRNINQYYRRDENSVVNELLENVNFSQDFKEEIHRKAYQMVTYVRDNPQERTQLEDFMQRYRLNTNEGIALMCLAESLLRIPDKETMNALILDKVGEGDWLDHTESGEKWLTKLSAWGLMISDQFLDKDNTTVFSKIVRRLGMPTIRTAMVHAMRLMGGHFVTGRTIEEALKNSKSLIQTGYSFSYDMLGEGARTQKDADFYFQQYKDAIDAIGQSSHEGDIHQRPSISVKLSALYPRYEYAKHKECVPFLTRKLLELAQTAKEYNIALTVDAEEARRLEMSLTIFENVYTNKNLNDWPGLGLAVQAYQKRCLKVLDYVFALAKWHQKIIPIRLVKGAYWDSEIKFAQENGLSDYPVFTRKESTDISYILAAQKMLDNRDGIYAQFATHNAHTISTILEMVGDKKTGFEFQRLHGMGIQLYQGVKEIIDYSIPVRIYAPVGQHRDLLPYLVRRLLENGANTSFINQIHDSEICIDDLIADPFTYLNLLTDKRYPKIPLPVNIYFDRQNAYAPDLNDEDDVAQIMDALEKYRDHQWIFNNNLHGAHSKIFNPADQNHHVGSIKCAALKDVDKVFRTAVKNFDFWHQTPIFERANILEKLAELLEKEYHQVLSLCVYEAGKTIPDAVAEIREAIDFCRYYAVQAKENFSDQGMSLEGPTGEDNRLYLNGRGVFVCISPWNFPLAIFVGQVVAALVSGNTVIAKPAEQTPLIAAYVLQLLQKAGLPENVMQLLPGAGDIGAELVKHPSLAGVVFTGSTDTAKHIQKSLVEHHKAILPLIAETGGQNAMIVDSSALIEQVVDDVIHSGFYSAGQRCSALRVLYLHEDIADHTIEMIVGAMRELSLGDPSLLSTDIGPVIDKAALSRLHEHLNEMKDVATQLSNRIDTPEKGTYCTPYLLEIDDIGQLKQENFGPIIHVIRFKQDHLDQIIHDINATGYGLTLGIHSRIDHIIEHIKNRVKVGNIYINRGMTGAVVGVQPFGGMGLSGTGPKAGGPYYLKAFMEEKTVSIDMTAAGGNTYLINLNDD